MARYVCTICGYVYEEELGDPTAGIAPGTKWEELSEDWVCPVCGATKAEFENAEPQGMKEADRQGSPLDFEEDRQELRPLELSALCTNLARGCEKQYKLPESEAFKELAEFFKNGAKPHADSNFDKLLSLVEKDLSEGFPQINEVAAQAGDRGALRALVWSEKVSRILKSLITRYQKDGEKMLENTGVYVCTICGFVYVGDHLPEVCPVCKVPNYKFEKVEGRA